jgi:hypothetical protein
MTIKSQFVVTKLSLVLTNQTGPEMPAYIGTIWAIQLCTHSETKLSERSSFRIELPLQSRAGTVDLNPLLSNFQLKFNMYDKFCYKGLTRTANYQDKAGTEIQKNFIQQALYSYSLSFTRKHT